MAVILQLGLTLKCSQLTFIQDLNNFTDVIVARSYWQITWKFPVKAKTYSQYTNLVKISQKQYSCTKRNFKSSLLHFWHGDFVYKLDRNDTVLQRQFCVLLWAWSVDQWECLCAFVLLVDLGTLGIPQQHAECPLREMLVHSGSLLHEMVFLEIIIKYF